MRSGVLFIIILFISYFEFHCEREKNNELKAENNKKEKYPNDKMNKN